MVFKGVSVFVDWWHLILTAFVTIVFLPLASDFVAGLALVVIAYLVASFIRPTIKKYLVKKTVLFDIHGVYISGDMNLEALYEVEGTKDLIQRLRKKYKVAALTNMGPELFSLWSRKWGFSHVYDYVYYSGQYGIKKPDERLYQIILKETHSTAANTVFLDDLEENVAAAKKLGIHGIVFKDAKSAEKELEKMGFGP
ncbi:HAD-IA family hydrolase [Candidatus Micrarchaeota archaeon]|nr:HAD-IA family hydrolase [Candidatus Micrarchaeota archaeon]